MKRTYTRYFQYQSDNEETALKEIENRVNSSGLFVSSIECVRTEKAEHLPEDWFDDYVFLFKVEIKTEERKSGVEEKLSQIPEYFGDSTDVEICYPPDKDINFTF